MTRVVVKSGCQKDTCYDKIGIYYAQTKDTGLGSLINIIGRAYVILYRERRIFIFTS